MRRLLLYPLFAALLVSGRPALAWDYTNPALGFGLDVPERFPVCMPAKHVPLDGVVIYLDGKPGICMQGQRRQLALNGYENTQPFETVTALRIAQCESDVEFEPGTWHFGTQPGQACYRAFRNDWVEVSAFALSAAMTQQQMADGPTPAIAYALHLRTHRTTLIEDLRATRQLITGIRLFTPQ
jgi:hypothetical protein